MLWRFTFLSQSDAFEMNSKYTQSLLSNKSFLKQKKKISDQLYENGL